MIGFAAKLKIDREKAMISGRLTFKLVDLEKSKYILIKR